jgi:hypothetical protein
MNAADSITRAAPAFFSEEDKVTFERWTAAAKDNGRGQLQFVMRL